VPFTLGAAVVALACVIASGRRLAHAVAPIGLEPRMLTKALEGERAEAVFQSLRVTAAVGGRLAWESELLAAFAEDDERRREALVGEHLLELEGRLTRSSRVPRVCASIASSAGLLFGTLGLLQGPGIPQETGGAIATQGAFASALAAVALGIAATAFCVAVHVRAARVERERRAAIDELVSVLQRLRSGRRG
jgi:AhpD family alkylhydroperoxidase